MVIARVAVQGRWMSELLERAIEVLKGLPRDRQDDVARMVLCWAGHDDVMVELTPEEEAAVLSSRAAVARGEIATDAQVRAVWDRYGG